MNSDPHRPQARLPNLPEALEGLQERLSKADQDDAGRVAPVQHRQLLW